MFKVTLKNVDILVTSQMSSQHGGPDTTQHNSSYIKENLMMLIIFHLCWDQKHVMSTLWYFLSNKSLNIIAFIPLHVHLL